MGRDGLAKPLLPERENHYCRECGATRPFLVLDRYLLCEVCCHRLDRLDKPVSGFVFREF